MSYLKFPGKTATICRRARQVMAGNRYLADYATRLSDAVTVIPTTIDTKLYRPELHRPRVGASVTIGWTGSHSTLRHLERLVPALSELARTHPFRLVVVGAEAPDVPGAEVVSRHWTAETEVEDLSDIDIGLMPLSDEPWTRGKCGLKVLQYMGLGIPAVVSPVGVNTEIVAHGENGLVANRDAAWVDHLKTLMNDSGCGVGSAPKRARPSRHATRRVLSHRRWRRFFAKPQPSADRAVYHRRDGRDDACLRAACDRRPPRHSGSRLDGRIMTRSSFFVWVSVTLAAAPLFSSQESDDELRARAARLHRDASSWIPMPT